MLQKVLHDLRVLLDSRQELPARPRDLLVQEEVPGPAIPHMATWLWVVGQEWVLKTCIGVLLEEIDGFPQVNQESPSIFLPRQPKRAPLLTWLWVVGQKWVLKTWLWVKSPVRPQ